MSDTIPPPTPSPPKRRWWVVSLRWFLIAVLLLNVAAAAWYQWLWTVRRVNTDPLRVSLLKPEIRLGQELSPHFLPNLHFFNQRRLSVHLSDWAWKRVQTRYHSQDGREDHGLTKLFFTDGSLHGVEEYHAGQLHGRYERYFPGGKLLTTGGYERGKMSGRWEIYRPDGGVLLRAEYDPPGVRRKMELHYLPEDADHYLPNWILASDARELEVDVIWTYVDGDLRRSDEVRRDPTGERRIVRRFLKGARDGRQENRDEQDRLRFVADWNQNRPDGHWACYGPDGACRLSAEFRAGRLVRVNGRELTRDSLTRIFRVGSDNYQFPVSQPIVLKYQRRSWRNVFETFRDIEDPDVEKPHFDVHWDEVVEWEWEGPDRAIMPMIREVITAKNAVPAAAETPAAPAPSAE